MFSNINCISYQHLISCESDQNFVSDQDIFGFLNINYLLRNK